MLFKMVFRWCIACHTAGHAISQNVPTSNFMSISQEQVNNKSSPIECIVLNISENLSTQREKRYNPSIINVRFRHCVALLIYLFQSQGMISVLRVTTAIVWRIRTALIQRQELAAAVKRDTMRSGTTVPTAKVFKLPETNLPIIDI